MRDQEADQAGGPLWTPGDMMFRVQGAGRGSDRIIKIRRPFALLGQAADVDITIADQAVSARHVYLHLDPRGVYAVDLVTRTGTRLNDTDRSVGWLRPGQSLEVAGRRIELLRAEIGGVVQDPLPCHTDLLAETSRATVVGVSLEPQRAAGCPWVLGSELVFLGWSASCGIPLKDRAVARTHCALVRTETAVYVIDLCGHHTSVDDRPVRGASIIHDGQVLTLGSARFIVRVQPAARTKPERSQNGQNPSTLVARIIEPEVQNSSDLSTPLEMIPPESQSAVLAWMMGTIQGNQGEALRQQGEFQLATTRLLHEIQQDNATLLNAHLTRLEHVDRELAAIRAELELERGGGGGDARAATTPSILLPPPVAPLRIPRTIPEPATSQTSTTWLLKRVRQIENENRSPWRAFLDRFALLPRRDT